MNTERASSVADTVGAEIVVGGAVLEVECDVLAPCALGGVLDGATVPRLRCRAICGAANNQLADDSIDDLLAAQGVLYAPDFIANAGGIINIAEEFVGYRRERAIARAEQIEHTTAAVLRARTRAGDRSGRRRGGDGTRAPRVGGSRSALAPGRSRRRGPTESRSGTSGRRMTAADGRSGARTDATERPSGVVDDDRALADVVATLRSEPEYGLDTEFMAEKTYYPQLCLLQLAWPGGVALVDPFACDVRALAALLGEPATMVTHAGGADLPIIERACGARPSRLFDTQLAAGFVGLGQPSLVSLVHAVLDVRLDKGDQLSDWTSPSPSRVGAHATRRVTSCTCCRWPRRCAPRSRSSGAPTGSRPRRSCSCAPPAATPIPTPRGGASRARGRSAGAGPASRKRSRRGASVGPRRPIGRHAS